MIAKKIALKKYKELLISIVKRRGNNKHMLSFSAKPLEGYSSLQEIPLLSLLGIKSKAAHPRLLLLFNFNLITPPKTHPKAILSFHVVDSSTPINPLNSDFRITNLTRWRIHLTQYEAFTSFLQKMKRRHYMRYEETRKTFSDYGVKLSVVDGDWSAYVDEFYSLYLNVAKKHGTQLYDRNYFQEIAKIKDYKLMCARYGEKLIAALVMIEEPPVFHSICCGLDYDHSKKCFAYSWMHYEFIRIAIEARKFTQADVGLTANAAKTMLDFEPVSSYMNVKANNRILSAMMRFISLFLTATINSQARLQLRLRLPSKKNN